MATILNPTDVVCEIDRLVVRDDGEAVGGAEPYLWSVFFKIDGEDSRASASIEVDNTGLHLSLDGEPTVRSPAGSHGNLNLAGDGVDAGGLFSGTKTVPVPPAVGQYRTTLTPLPTSITIQPDSLVAEFIDDAAVSLQDILDSLGGGYACPPSTGDSSQLLADLAIEFVTGTVGGIPGVFGAIYLLMEEDFTADDVAEDARRALRDSFREEMTDTVMPSISLSQQGPTEAVIEEIEIRIRQEVTDAVVNGINWWWLLFGTIGLGVIADQDDPLGVAQVQMSHLQIALGEDLEIGEDLPDEGHGDWSLRGRIGLD
ncbi:hypothetical protein [Arthrobacter sp. Ld5]|uniref:hypothetical protein n=1 Tax=Arthrobacter sp. Ld5 TaxID=649152 RepID=UPI003EB746B6